MTQEQIKEFNEVCGVDPEMDKPAILRKREALADQERVDQENSIIEEAKQEAEDKINHQV